MKVQRNENTTGPVIEELETDDEGPPAPAPALLALPPGPQPKRMLRPRLAPHDNRTKHTKKTFKPKLQKQAPGGYSDDEDDEHDDAGDAAAGGDIAAG